MGTGTARRPLAPAPPPPPPIVPPHPRLVATCPQSRSPWDLHRHAQAVPVTEAGTVAAQTRRRAQLARKRNDIANQLHALTRTTPTYARNSRRRTGSPFASCSPTPAAPSRTRGGRPTEHVAEQDHPQGERPTHKKELVPHRSAQVVAEAKLEAHVDQLRRHPQHQACRVSRVPAARKVPSGQSARKGTMRIAASRSSDRQVYGRVGSLSEYDSVAGLVKPRYGRSPEHGPHQRRLVDAATRVAPLRMVKRLPRVDRVANGRGNGQRHNGDGARHPERRRHHGSCVYFGHQHWPGADVRGGSRAASTNRAPAPTAPFIPARKPQCAAAGCTG